MSTATTDEAPTRSALTGCPICGEARGHRVQASDLDCPDCLDRAGIHSKMGNKRRDCNRCNAFAQRVIRASARSLQAMYPADYDDLRSETEADLYAEEMKRKR